jgi:hypothetical protein
MAMITVSVLGKISATAEKIVRMVDNVELFCRIEDALLDAYEDGWAAAKKVTGAELGGNAPSKAERIEIGSVASND